MLKKHNLRTLILVPLLIGSAYAQQSFVNFGSFAPGSLTGAGSWAGYGSLNWNVNFAANSVGTDAAFPDPSPVPFESVGGDVDVFQTLGNGRNEALAVYPGTVDGTTNNIGYTLTLTFSGGQFPISENLELVITDVDESDLLIEASLGGSLVDVSGWYTGAVQTDSAISPQAGPPAIWDGTSTLSNTGLANWWAHRFSPTSAFDTLTITHSGDRAPDWVSYSLSADVVPEPSGFLLVCLGALSYTQRRKR